MSNRGKRAGFLGQRRACLWLARDCNPVTKNPEATPALPLICQKSLRPTSRASHTTAAWILSCSFASGPVGPPVHSERPGPFHWALDLGLVPGIFPDGMHFHFDGLATVDAQLHWTAASEGLRCFASASTVSVKSVKLSTLSSLCRLSPIALPLR